MSAVIVVFNSTVSYAAKPKVTVKLDIGRKKLNCDKFSICSIEIGVSERLASNQVNGTAEFTPEGRLKITINKSMGLTKECYGKYFESGTFLIEEEVQIPSEILSEIDNSPASYNVRTGKYDIDEKGDAISIIF